MKKEIRIEDLTKLRFLLPDSNPTQAWLSHGRKLFKVPDFFIDFAIPDVNANGGTIKWFYEDNEDCSIISHKDMSGGQRNILESRLINSINLLEKDIENFVKQKQVEALAGINKFLEIPDESNIYGVYNSSGSLIKILFTNWATVYDVLNPNFGIVRKIKPKPFLSIAIRIVDKNGKIRENFDVNISYINLSQRFISNDKGMIEIEDIDKGTVINVWQEINGEILNKRDYLIQKDETIDYCAICPVDLSFTAKNENGELLSNRSFDVEYRNRMINVLSDATGIFILKQVIPGENIKIISKQ